MINWLGLERMRTTGELLIRDAIRLLEKLMRKRDYIQISSYGFDDVYFEKIIDQGIIYLSKNIPL